MSANMLRVQTCGRKAVDLYFVTNMGVISFFEHLPLNSMPEDELTEFLNTTEFSEPQKRLVIEREIKSGAIRISWAGDISTLLGASLRHECDVAKTGYLCAA
jgi:hypothetical protein